MGFRTVIDGIGVITETSPGDFATTGIIAEDITSVPNDIYAGGCVTRGMNVQATSPASNSVEILAGKAWVLNDAWTAGSLEQRLWPVNNDSLATLSITPNISGNPRIDLVCVKVDPGATPGDDGAANCGYVAVVGTPNVAPVAPAVPANHTPLAALNLANNYTSITASDIVDVRPVVEITARGSWFDGWNLTGLVVGSSDFAVTSSDPIHYDLTIPGDVRNLFWKGVKVRFMDSGVFYYAWVGANPSYNSGTNETTVNLYPGRLYTAGHPSEAEAIWTSAMEYPIGFPNMAHFLASANEYTIASSSSIAVVTLANVNQDPGNNWDSGNNRFVIPVDGIYEVTGCSAWWGWTGAASVAMQLYLPSANKIFVTAKPSNAGMVDVAGTQTRHLAAGSLIQLGTYQNSGSDQNIRPNRAGTFLGINLLRVA